MTYTSEQIINGLMSYAEAEVMGKLPTAGKWIMGTAIVLAANKMPQVAKEFVNHPLVRMLGVVDEDEKIDADAMLQAMRTAADKYGSMTLDVPMVGKLTFSVDDVDRLKAYIS